MDEQTTETGSKEVSASKLRGSTASAFSGAWRFVAAHPLGVVHALIACLAGIVVLQNLEPTSIDFLFWSFLAVPKLVILLLAMVLGGALWEIARRSLRR